MKSCSVVRACRLLRVWEEGSSKSSQQTEITAKYKQNKTATLAQSMQDKTVKIKVHVEMGIRL